MSTPQTRASYSDEPESYGRPTYDASAFRSYAPLLRETLNALHSTPEIPPSLELPTKSLDDLQWHELLEHLAVHCISDDAARIARRLPFLGLRESLERRLHEVEEATRLVCQDQAPPLRGLRPIQNALDHAHRGGILDGSQLLAIASCAKVSGGVKVYFKSRDHLSPLLAQIAEDLHTMPEIVQTIEKAFDPSGVLADHASPDLGSLRRRVNNYHDRIRKRLDGYLKNQDFQGFLQDDYYTLREERYVLPIRAGEKGSVPGIVHGTSGSGQTIFIEPTELVELNNDLRLAQLEVLEEERKILARLTKLIGHVAPQLKGNAHLLTYIDLTVAMGHMSAELGAHRPTISPNRLLNIQNARHPILIYKSIQSPEPFDVVANDFLFGDTAEDGTVQRVLVVSGPNTGGKTVSLKTIGLFSLMVRAGLLIPARAGGQIPLFDQILTDIGDEQSIERDLSTFSGHVVNITSFIHKIGPRSLVLLDELFAGTDPAQGSALATALLEYLADRQSMVAVTTHLDGVKTLAIEEPRFTNAAVGFDVRRLAPTYRLSMGLPGSSYAIRIARRLGLPETILKRAQIITEGIGQAEIETILKNLERERERLAEELSQAQRERRETARLKARYEAKLHKIRDDRRALLDKEVEKTLSDVQDAKVKIREYIKQLNNSSENASTQALERLRADLNKTSKDLREKRETNRTQRKRSQALSGSSRRPALAEELSIGDEVWVATFKRKGVLLDNLDNQQRTSVQIGSIRATVQLDDLYTSDDMVRRNESRRSSETPTNTPRTQEKPSETETTPRGPIAPQHPGNTVDLRGMRTDDAIERVELFLDAAYHDEEPGVYIIHGHGTGALKRAIRTFLPSSRYTSSFRPGEQGEGGDGVTVVYLS